MHVDSIDFNKARIADLEEEVQLLREELRIRKEDHKRLHATVVQFREMFKAPQGFLKEAWEAIEKEVEGAKF